MKWSDAAETDEADQNQIDGNDIVQKPWHDQDQNAGNERHQRRDMGNGQRHGEPPVRVRRDKRDNCHVTSRLSRCIVSDRFFKSVRGECVSLRARPQ